MPDTRDLEPLECVRLLRGGVMGRVALATPEGPHIVPVHYGVFEDTLVVRTSTYSLLGTYGRNAMLAIEVGDLDHHENVGWSVVARGRAWAEVDRAAIESMRSLWSRHPWSNGVRDLYLRMRWEHLTGRALEKPSTRVAPSRVPHALNAS